jgi:hypothetical protein
LIRKVFRRKIEFYKIDPWPVTALTILKTGDLYWAVSEMQTDVDKECCKNAKYAVIPISPRYVLNTNYTTIAEKIG